MKANKKKIDASKLTTQQLEEVIRKEDYKPKYIQILKSTIYTIIIIAAFGILLATLIMPVFEIKGDSMKPTYNDGDIVIAFNTNRLKQDDVIAFYYGNKILVKRIIAMEGDWVNIKDGIFYVNGNLIPEISPSKDGIDYGDIEYPYQVPSNQIFVLSDNRTDMQDSRNSQIGCIKKDDILGKVLLKLWNLK